MTHKIQAYNNRGTFTFVIDNTVSTELLNRVKDQWSEDITKMKEYYRLNP